MSVIHPLKPRQERHTCPDCGAPEGLIEDAEHRIFCKMCDWKSSEPIGTIELDEPDNQPVFNKEPDIRDLRNFLPLSYYIQDRDRISVWGKSAYETALDHVGNKEWDEAIVDLYRALEMDTRFTEAHIWLGRLLTDEKKQREHLNRAIGNPKALLEILYLDGRISLSQLEHALRSGGEVIVKRVKEPIKSETVILTCPVCGGHMTAHPLTGHVECAYCGHIEDAAPDQPDTADRLSTSLWLRQAEGSRWDIKARIIHCENCGADRTLTDGTMGTYCLYCGSRHIIVQDALNSFRQPDGIIPFTIPQKQAEQAIYARLFERWERFKGLFVVNSVKQATFTGIYLPFWVFNLQVDIQFPNHKLDTRSETHRKYAFPAVLSPSPRLIEKINYFDVSAIQAYEPSLLARYSAEIYQVDFDKASLEVRGQLRRLLGDKYNNSDEQVAVAHRWSIVNDMTFQLALFPIWIATLIEDDGDVRIGLVNGQNGRTVVGKARKPANYS